MKKTAATLEFEFLGTYYRVTSFIGPNIVHLERGIPSKIMKRGIRWESVHHGHADPLEETLRFFKETLAAPTETITNKEA